MTTDQLVANYRELGYHQHRKLRVAEGVKVELHKRSPAGNTIVQVVQNGKTIRTYSK